MKHDIWFFLGVFGFILGVGLSSFLFIGWAFIYFGFLIACTFFVCFFILKKNEQEKGRYKLFIFLGIIIFSFSLGTLRYQIGEAKNNTFVDTFLNNNISIIGIISEEPDRREGSTLLTLDVEKPFESKILVIAERFPEFEYGDRVSFEGKIEEPEAFKTDNGKIFDYPSYLASKGIYYVVFRPKIILLDTSKGNPVKEKLLKLKDSFVESAGFYIREPEISLLGGLLVGAKHGLSKDWQEILRSAGIIHIVVLSGYNITIVAEAIMGFFGFLTIRYRLIVGAIAITLFAIMTGASATIVRASLMALLVLLARATGRTYQITRALSIAGLVMIIHNPKILVFDPSFQLSFLATLGLVYLSPLLEKYFSLVPTRFKIRELVLATISTQIFVLPLLLFMMGEVSLVSLPTNLLVLIFIPITMLFGFITGLVGFVSSTLSFPFAYVTGLLLSYELGVAKFFGSLPFSTISISFFPAPLMFFSYIILIFGIYFFHMRINRKKLQKISLTDSGN